VVTTPLQKMHGHHDLRTCFPRNLFVLVYVQDQMHSMNLHITELQQNPGRCIKMMSHLKIMTFKYEYIKSILMDILFHYDGFKTQTSKW
jgi:hypothetical protein